MSEKVKSNLQKVRKLTKSRKIRLSDLRSPSGHPGRLAPRVRRALLWHIGATGLYPPLIVRPADRDDGTYEILDGDQRASILKELRIKFARCEVWPVDSHQGELFRVALNSLGARADARTRARQLDVLIRRFGRDRTAELLALTPAAMKQQLAVLGRAVAPAERTRPLDLRPVVFHLPAGEATELDRTLRGLASKRADALMAAIRIAAAKGAGRNE